MKSLLVASCLFLVVAIVRADMDEETRKFIELSNEYLEQCAKDQGIPETEMVKFHEMNLEGDDRLKFGCLHACLMKKIGVMEGTAFNADKIQELLDKTYTDPEASAAKLKMTTECIEAVKDQSEECEVAFEFVRCYTNKDTAA